MNESWYREYLTRQWVSDSVALVKKHKRSKWYRFTNWMKRRTK